MMTRHPHETDVQRRAARIAGLYAKHAQAQAALAEEQRRPAPNSAFVRLLKMRKLKLKDEIALLEQTIRRR